MSIPLWIWLVDFGALSAGHHNPMRTAGIPRQSMCAGHTGRQSTWALSGR
ncbi:TPA: hypothetical protein SMI57_002527 [Serratia liquefaciens]|nr:hypothetical protein [Serratia liquefaciens]